MANILSNIKSAKKNKILRAKNNAIKSSIKTAIKKTLNAFQNEEEKKQNFSTTQKLIAKSVSKGVLHRNTAARKISKLALNLNKLSKN